LYRYGAVQDSAAPNETLMESKVDDLWIISIDKRARGLRGDLLLSHRGVASQTLRLAKTSD
jgi:hypothetical protein